MATNDNHGILDLTGRRALVTGASRGIGAAIIRLLSAAGADVMIGYRTRSADAQAVADEAIARGVRAHTHAADVATAEGAEGLVRATVRELGGIDIFVANAGIWPEEDGRDERRSMASDGSRKPRLDLLHHGRRHQSDF